MGDVLGGNVGRSVQRRAQRRDGWTRQARAAFLDALATTGNVRYSARKAGRAGSSVYRLRRRDAAFAAAWQEALETAYVLLEAALLARAMGGEAIDPAPGEDAGDDDVEAAPFDPKLALTMLARHDAKTSGRARPSAGSMRQATLAEVEISLRKKLDALAKRLGKTA